MSTSQTEVGWIPSQSLHEIDEFVPVTETAIPLIKEVQPESPGVNKKYEPRLVWRESEVRRTWVIRDMTEKERVRIWADGEAFLLTFSLEEQIGIALSAVPIIAALRLRLSARKSEIWANDPLVQLGLGVLVAEGILTPERAVEVSGV